MYALANVDFSNRLGFVVSEFTPDEIDSQDQTLDATDEAALSDLPTTSSSSKKLEMAVFGAA
jgi:hypothetical protein